MDISILPCTWLEHSSQYLQFFSNLDDSGQELPEFAPRTNNAVDKTVVTLKMVKKAISELDLSKAKWPDGIPVVVLKNSEPELLHKLKAYGVTGEILNYYFFISY